MTDHAPATVDLRKYIDHHFFGGLRPHIRGRRLPVVDIAAFARSEGITVTDIAEAFSISDAEVLAALLYYQAHQTEIDAYEQAAAQVTAEEWVKHGDRAPLLRRNDAPSSSE